MGIMTVSKNLKITCNGCHESLTWAISVLRSRTIESILENEGFYTESNGFLEGNKHYCPGCNDREKETFHVCDGYGEEYLGTIEAWGKVDARKVAWEAFDCENMVSRQREELMSER